MDNNCKIDIISDNKRFKNIKDEWNELLRNSLNDTLFLRWEWIYNWWNIYQKKNYKLFIITAREKNRIIGIAPFYIKKNILGISQIFFIGTNEVCSDYLDIIAEKNKEIKVGSLILKYLCSKRKIYGAVYLSDVPMESKTNLIVSMIKKREVFVRFEEKNICPYLEFDKEWKDIYDGFDPILKNIIKKKRKKIEELQKVKYVKINNNNELIKMYDEFILLNKKRLSYKSLKSPFADKKFYKFHMDIMKDLKVYRIPTLYFITIKDVPIASLYIFNYKDKYYYYQSGFEEKWEKYSPGTLLMHHVIKSAFLDNAIEFDFLRGNEKYKKMWTKKYRKNVNITIYSKNLRGKILFIYDKKRNSFKAILSHFKRYGALFEK